jgi:hypothetical protein
MNRFVLVAGFCALVGATTGTTAHLLLQTNPQSISRVMAGFRDFVSVEDKSDHSRKLAAKASPCMDIANSNEKIQSP